MGSGGSGGPCCRPECRCGAGCVVITAGFWGSSTGGSGVAWRGPSECCGPWWTVWERHRAWVWDGALDAVHRALMARAGERGGLDWDAGVDSCVVRAHQRAANTSCRTGGLAGVVGTGSLSGPAMAWGAPGQGRALPKARVRLPDPRRGRPGIGQARTRYSSRTERTVVERAFASHRQWRGALAARHGRTRRRPPTGLLIHTILTRPTKETHPRRASPGCSAGFRRWSGAGSSATRAPTGDTGAGRMAARRCARPKERALNADPVLRARAWPGPRGARAPLDQRAPQGPECVAGVGRHVLAPQQPMGA